MVSVQRQGASPTSTLAGMCGGIIVATNRTVATALTPGADIYLMEQYIYCSKFLQRAETTRGSEPTEERSGYNRSRGRSPAECRTIEPTFREEIRSIKVLIVLMNDRISYII